MSLRTSSTVACIIAKFYLIEYLREFIRESVARVIHKWAEYMGYHNALFFLFYGCSK